MDYTTNVLSTNGGAIFELYVHGVTTLVILRPSTGSTVYFKLKQHGPQAALVMLASFHNQLVAVGKLMGKDIPNFTTDTSPLSDLLWSGGAARITATLHETGLLPLEVVYFTPQQLGGMWSPYAVFLEAGYDREAARAVCAPIAALLTAAAREAAIVALDVGLHEAARMLVRQVRGGRTYMYAAFLEAGYDSEAAHSICAPIAVLLTAAAREAAIVALDVGLHEAARMLVSTLVSPSHSNRDYQYINVEILGTLKPFFYACSHAAAAHHLAERLNIKCKASSLRALLKGTIATACKRITRLDVKDMEKAELLGETGALELAYKRSPAFETVSAYQRAKHLSPSLPKKGGPGLPPGWSVRG